MKIVLAFLVVLAVLPEKKFVETSRRWIQTWQNNKLENGSCTGIPLVNAFEFPDFASLRKKGGFSRSRRMVSKRLANGPVSASSLSDLLFCSIDDDEILSMDAISLSKAIQIERSLSCEQLMKATLDRIDKINPTLNAIILMRDKRILMNEARSCDRVLDEILDSNVSTENVQKQNIGWLYGIPVAIKDVSNAKNLPTTMGGSPLYCKSPENLTLATFSDPYVENMIEDGAIVIGKTNAPEGGLGSNTFNDMWGKTLNPYAFEADQTSISAGGSSGGAAVAIATKMLALADGTDNMGSLRNPAGWNNIYSLRPTAGLVPAAQRKNRSALASILPHPASTPGPMARTPRDCARFLQSLVRDTKKFNAESLWTTQETLPETIRIGWLGDWNGRVPIEDGILSTCQSALENWSAANSSKSRIVVENLHNSQILFDFDKLWEGYNAIRFASTLETYSQQFDVEALLSSMKTDTRRPMKEELAWEFEQGQRVDEKALKQARDIYDKYEEWLHEIFLDTNKDPNDEGFHVLALPSAQVWPFPIDNRYPKDISGTKMDTYHRWMEVCVPVSFGGLPCVTIPAGFGKNRNRSNESPALQNLPIGIQLFGKKGDDGKLLHLADEYYRYRCNATKSTDK